MNGRGIEPPITRRRLLTIGVAGGVTFLVGCGTTANSGAGWSFVDDRRHAIRLKTRPTRIVAYTSAAAALYDWGVTPVGVFGEMKTKSHASVVAALSIGAAAFRVPVAAKQLFKVRTG